MLVRDEAEACLHVPIKLAGKYFIHIWEQTFYSYVNENKLENVFKWTQMEQRFIQGRHMDTGMVEQSLWKWYLKMLNI